MAPRGALKCLHRTLARKDKHCRLPATRSAAMGGYLLKIFSLAIITIPRAWGGQCWGVWSAHPPKCSITWAFFFPLDHCRRLLSSQCNAARVTHNDGAGISIARHFYLATLERGQPSIGDWLALGWVLFSSNPCYIYYLHSTTPCIIVSSAKKKQIHYQTAAHVR